MRAPCKDMSALLDSQSNLNMPGYGRLLLELRSF